MERFTINKSKKYLVYGAGGNGYKVVNILQEKKYHVAAVLDERAEELSDVCGVPVHKMDHYAEADNKKEQSIVIITIKNVFAHRTVARKLLFQGYKNIIYKPYPILQGERGEDWESINDIYEMLVEQGRLDQKKKEELDCACSDIGRLSLYRDELCMEFGQESTVCWLPAELLCNYNRNDAYGLLPMAAYYPLINFYSYMLSSNLSLHWTDVKKDLLLYSADWVARTQGEFTENLKKSMINSRIDVFYEMQKKADYEKDFFIRNVVSVSRMQNGRFYLTASGRNRISFMIARGYRFVPVKMSVTDYTEWVNRDEADKLKKILDRRDSRVFTSIPHPELISCPAETVDYVQLFCMPVIKEIYRYLHWNAVKQERGYGIIDTPQYNRLKKNLLISAMMEDDGCVGRLLCMYEFQCVRFWSKEQQNEISRYIDNLFGVSGEDIKLTKDSAAKIQQAQICIIDTSMDLSFLQDYTGKLIFLLQWGDEFEMRMKGTWEKKMLCKTIWKGMKVSGWMFQRINDQI